MLTLLMSNPASVPQKIEKTAAQKMQSGAIPYWK